MRAARTRRKGRGRGVAHSYAEALWELGAEAGRERLDRLERDLERACRLIEESELYEALRHPLIPKRERLALARAALERLGVDEYVRNLILLVVERGRVSYLGAILQELRELRQERERLIYGVVYTPYPLDGLLDRLEARLAELTGREVRLEERLAPELIGGIKLKLGDLVLDGSVAAQLERLREQLLERRLELE